MKINAIHQLLSTKKILVTGHNGFKGSWLVKFLEKFNASVAGISLEKNSNNLFSFNSGYLKDEFLGDISNKPFFSKALKKSDPDIIFHMAAQPLVLPSYQNPYKTFETNVLGTLNLLEIMREDFFNTKDRIIIIVTTDKVYKDNGKEESYTESDELGGYDPYSSSKAAVELISFSYFSSFYKKSKNLKIASARAGNVIGGGDNSDFRIVPDVINAMLNSKDIHLRMPNAVRPWQHVLEPLFGYIKLACNLLTTSNSINSEYPDFNFGPNEIDFLSVEDITKLMIDKWGSKSKIIKADSDLHEASYLTLSSKKAYDNLNWYPIWDSKTSITKTVNWYKEFYCNDQSDTNLMENDIDAYLNNFRKLS